MKKLFIALIIVLVFCGAALWYLASQINPLVKAQIEKQGKHYTEQTVSVESVNIELKQGKGTINNVLFNNPASFTSPQWLKVGEISLDIDTKQLKEPYIIEAIALRNTAAMIEFNQQGKANVQQIMDAIKAKLPKSATSVKSTDKSGRDPLIIVKRLVIEDLALTVDLTALGNKSHQESLNLIELGDIGGETGVPASQLGGEIGKRIANQLWQAAKDKQKSKLLDKIKDKANEKLNDLLNKFGN